MHVAADAVLHAALRLPLVSPDARPGRVDGETEPIGARQVSVVQLRPRAGTALHNHLQVVDAHRDRHATQESHAVEAHPATTTVSHTDRTGAG